MIKRMNPEIFEQRKKLITDYLETHDNVKSSVLKGLLGFPRSTNSLFLTRLKNMGIIFRSGGATSPRYWANEERYLAAGRQIEAAEVERVHKLTRKAAFKVSDRDTLIYLNKKRPAGVNTVFEDCKRNSTMLPVLKVMSRRLYG